MNTNFRKRLFLWFVIVSVIPSILIGSFSYFMINKEIQKDTETLVTNVNDGIYNMVDTQQRVLNQWLPSAAESFVSKLENLGDSHFDYNQMVNVNNYIVPTWYIGDQKITHDYTLVDELIEKEKLPATIFMLVDNKFLRVSTNVRQERGQRIVDTDISEGPVFNKLINGQVYLGRASVEGIMHATIYMPIFNSDNKLIGAFVLGRKEKEYEMTNAIEKIKIFEDGYVMIMDSGGNVLIHPELSGENLSSEEWVQGIIKKQNGSINFTYEGKEKIAYYKYFEPWDWYIVSIGFVEDIFSNSKTLSNMLFLTILFSIIISLIIAYTISNEIFRPLYSLVNNLKKMKNGDLSTRFTSYIGEEFEYISNTFNSMSYTYSLLIGRIIVTSNDLETSSSRLLNDLDRSKLTLNNIEKNSDGLFDYALKSEDKETKSIDFFSYHAISSDISALKIKIIGDAEELSKEQSDIINALTEIEEKNFRIIRSCENPMPRLNEDEYKNKFNYLYLEVQKLKLLLDNIYDSASSLDEIANELDKQVNIFKVGNEPFSNNNSVD